MSRKYRGGFSSSSGIDYAEFKKVQLDISENKKKNVLVLPVNGPFNEREKNVAVNYINYRDSMKDTPFYILGKEQERLQTDNGINDGIKRYSDRYIKKNVTAKKLRNYPLHDEFFPAELHEVLGTGKGKKNFEKISSKAKNSSNELFQDMDDDESKRILEQLNNIAENEDDKEKKEDSEEEEIEDEEYDDDADDDYNAEKYFDDGDDFGDDMADDDEEAF